MTEKRTSDEVMRTARAQELVVSLESERHEGVVVKVDSDSRRSEHDSRCSRGQLKLSADGRIFKFNTRDAFHTLLVRPRARLSLSRAQARAFGVGELVTLSIRGPMRPRGWETASGVERRQYLQGGSQYTENVCLIESSKMARVAGERVPLSELECTGGKWQRPHPKTPDPDWGARR